jgi:hypothetical protein
VRPFVDAVVTNAAGLTASSDSELYVVVTPLAVWMTTNVG